MGEKTYILDTTVLLYDPDVFYKLGAGRIVVPIAVIKELDGLKRGESETAYKARKVARLLDIWGSYDDFKMDRGLGEGRKLFGNCDVIVTSEYEHIDALASEADNRILGTAIIRKKRAEDVAVLTTDTNMRNAARALGLKVRFYPGFMAEVDAARKAVDEDMSYESPAEPDAKLGYEPAVLVGVLKQPDREYNQYGMRMWFARLFGKIKRKAVDKKYDPEDELFRTMDADMYRLRQNFLKLDGRRDTKK